MELRQVLVVEDSYDHQEGAIKSLKDYRVVRRLSLFGNLEDFLKGLKGWGCKPGEFGVLTDLFFPVSKNDSSGELAPLGLVVLMKCQSLGIPCVIVTAGYHHGTKYNQATSVLTVLDLWHNEYLVDHFDQDDSEAEAKEKDWSKGLEQLKAQAAKIGAE